MSKNVVMIGAGVANVNAATKLIDNGFKGKITIIDMGKDPYLRPYEEVMTGFLGAGGWSDGKLTYHTSIGGQLSKYCGEEKAMELFDQVIDNFKRFHPICTGFGSVGKSYFSANTLPKSIPDLPTPKMSVS